MGSRESKGTEADAAAGDEKPRTSATKARPRRRYRFSRQALNEQVANSPIDQGINSLITQFDDTLQFRNAPDTSRPLGPVESCAWDNLQWYRQSTNLQKLQLRSFLLEMDRIKRVDVNNRRTREIHEGVIAIMETLTGKMRELDERFDGKLFKVGSFHNDTKIIEPNEFDFSYELDICKLLNNGDAFLILEGDELRVDTPDVSEDYRFFDFPNNDDRLFVLKTDQRSYLNAVTKTETHDVFNHLHVALAFFLLLKRTLGELRLPDGWSHGGFDQPKFSGIRFNLPAFLIQLCYAGSANHHPLQISIDFAPVLKVTNLPDRETKSVLEHFLTDKGYDNRQWVPLAQNAIKDVFVFAQEVFLAEYAAESVPKTAIRLCKELHKEARLSTPRCLDLGVAQQIAKHRKSRVSDDACPMPAKWQMHRFMLFPDELRLTDVPFATYSDVGETVNRRDFEYLSSYTFKLAVMTLLALDPRRGQSWKNHDLPELVLSIFMIVNDITVANHKALPDLTLRRGPPRSLGKVSLSLTGYYCGGLKKILALVSRVTSLFLDWYHLTLRPLLPSRLGTLGCSGKNNNKGFPRFYCALKQAIDDGDCPDIVRLLSVDRYNTSPVGRGNNLMLSPVFTLLRCGLQGKPRADFDIWSRKRSGGFASIEDYLIRKDELLKLMGSTLN